MLLHRPLRTFALGAALAYAAWFGAVFVRQSAWAVAAVLLGGAVLAALVYGWSIRVAQRERTPAVAIALAAAGGLGLSAATFAFVYVSGYVIDPILVRLGLV